MEQRIAREDDLVVAVLHKVADAVLGVARRVQRLDADVLPDGKGLAVAGRLGHLLAVLAADDVEGQAQLG